MGLRTLRIPEPAARPGATIKPWTPVDSREGSDPSLPCQVFPSKRCCPVGEGVPAPSSPGSRGPPCPTGSETVVTNVTPGTWSPRRNRKAAIWMIAMWNMSNRHNGLSVEPRSVGKSLGRGRVPGGSGQGSQAAGCSAGGRRGRKCTAPKRGGLWTASCWELEAETQGMGRGLEGPSPGMLVGSLGHKQRPRGHVTSRLHETAGRAARGTGSWGAPPPQGP